MKKKVNLDDTEGSAISPTSAKENFEKTLNSAWFLPEGTYDPTTLTTHFSTGIQ